ncbi:MAG: amino acid adenylation domain-containing protein, partial [Pyrinomonadaceae bacterium]
MSELSKRIADLSPEHLDLLFDRLNQQSEIKVQEETITPRSEADSFPPLSFAQERFWFLDRLMPGTNVYNIHGAIRLDGVPDTAALERALGEIIRRHEILRTTISTIDGNPVQVIAAPSEFELQVTDLGSLRKEDREPEALRLAAAEARWSFDLSRDRLFRPALIRLSEHQHILILTMHHMISDGWSFGILIEELSALYTSFCDSKPLSLSDLTIQYADFALWQREQLQGEKLESLLSYWKTQLDSAPAVIELPTDRPRPPVQSYQGAAVSFVVSTEASEALKRLSNEQGATLFMTLLAAFETFLSRYTGKTDVLIGTPVAGRNRIETEKLIGLFLNTLVIRADTSGDPMFCELLDRVRGVTHEAYTHQDLPFEKLVDELQLERTLSRAALIQVMFVFQNIPMPDFDLAGLNLSQIEVESGTAKFDLTLTMMDEGGQLSGYLEYNTDLFQSETIARLLANFQTLLEGIAANPRRRLSELPLLTETERRTLLTEWNKPDVTFPARLCIHHTFEKQAEALPDAVAVICGDRSATYRELNERANQLAHYLRDSGVGPGMLVCICIDHSIEMLVGLLGVLKAGGTYVPLDPGYPKERLAYMLEDTGSTVLLTQKEQLEKLPSYAGKIVCLDRDWFEIAQHSQEDLHVPSSPDSPAYVIYTSGSTGNPKGAVVTHRNVDRLFEATTRWFHFNQQDVWTLFHSFAFDFSVWEIWGALLHGGRLVVVPYLVSRTPEAFYDLLCNERVTVLNQTPSAFRQLMKVDESATKKLDLRLVIFGGEALEIGSLGAWFDRHGDRKPELMNMYGITETTVHVTYRRITKADVRKGPASCVGNGIADLQVYVLDENLQLAPIGVAGELYVGGGGLAQGYLNRADLTAARFIPNPFTQRAGERLYKTGDLARYSGQGDIEYLGRIDHQVKIRGFRIELGEIEAFLSQCTGVREAAVLAREDESGDKRLVAYVVTDQEQTVTGSELRSSLIEKLPDYMVPAAFVMLDSLPLTPNGKLDTRLLLSSNLERPEPEETFAAPRTWLEEALAHVWAQVLDLDRVGIHDNFFALGGDSILSVRAVSLMKERGLNFSLEQLFRHQTICELAQQFEKIETPSDEPKTEPFSLVSEEDRAKLPDDLEDAYPLTRGQVGLFYQMELTPSSPVYHNVDTLSFRVSRFDAEALERAVERVVARHPIMRTSFDLANYSEPLQLVHKTARLPVAVEDLRHLSPAEQEQVLEALVEKEKHYRFDLASAPLLRFHVHRVTDDVFQLTQTESHPVHDGWSMNSMLVEMFKHYTALLDGHVLPEEPPAASFRDFVFLERQALASEESRKFWDEKLSDLTTLKLPVPEAKADDSQAHLHVVPLSSEKFKRLEQLARTLAVPLKSVLLAAHVKTLGLVSGERDVLTGLASHGRAPEAGGELARGFFLNIMPFRMKLDDGTWNDLALEAFKLELDALPHRRYPLSELQSRHGRQALIETTFNFINFHILDDLSQGGVEMLGLSHSINVTHFALTTTFSLNKWYWGTYFEDASMIIALQYDPTKLSREFVETLSDYYLNVLDRMASDPLSHHGGRSLLTAAEQQRVLIDWNNTVRDYPLEINVCRLVEAQVEVNPEAVAVVCDSDRLSYRELNGRANRLARHLQHRGIDRESVVGLCLNRSVDFVVAMLACLKAGAAFLPLDPLYPAHRLQLITQDARMALLLSHSTLAGRLPDGPTEVVWMDHVWEQCRGVSEENLAVEIDPR